MLRGWNYESRHWTNLSTELKDKTFKFLRYTNMRTNEMLNQIKTLLDIQVKLETMKLENGTDIEADAFEKGKEVFILTDDEKVAMPVGEYILEDSRLLVVEEEGMIADVRDVSDDVPEKEETTEDLADDKEEKDEKKMAEVGDWEGMKKLKKWVTEIKRK